MMYRNVYTDFIHQLLLQISKKYFTVQNTLHVPFSSLNFTTLLCPVRE